MVGMRRTPRIRGSERNEAEDLKMHRHVVLKSRSKDSNFHFRVCSLRLRRFANKIGSVVSAASSFVGGDLRIGTEGTGSVRSSVGKVGR